jgi:hypothetical protein
MENEQNKYGKYGELQNVFFSLFKALNLDKDTLDA